MITTKLIGGLGNQMFQYAAGRRAAYVNNTSLKLDITGYDNQKDITKREYMLHIFRIDEQFVTKEEIAEFKKPISLLARFFSRQIPLYVKEKYFHFDPKVLSAPDNAYLEGYWVSEKYFEDISDVIRKEFTFKSKPDRKNRELLKQISACNSISIHVRRGDYVTDRDTHKFHGVCGLDYYKKAVSYIIGKVINPVFFIFSDDSGWCKDNLHLHYQTKYVTHNLSINHCEDMRLMSACKHNIIANSSFSWWGAWLNENPDKTVIAPRQWFRDMTINTTTFIPDSWMTMNNVLN